MSGDNDASILRCTQGRELRNEGNEVPPHRGATQLVSLQAARLGLRHPSGAVTDRMAKSQDQPFSRWNVPAQSAPPQPRREVLQVGFIEYLFGGKSWPVWVRRNEPRPRDDIFEIHSSGERFCGVEIFYPVTGRFARQSKRQEGNVAIVSVPNSSGSRHFIVESRWSLQSQLAMDDHLGSVFRRDPGSPTSRPSRAIVEVDTEAQSTRLGHHVPKLLLPASGHESIRSGRHPQ